MSRKAKELSALAVSKISTCGFYFVGGTAGLALQVAPSGARSWILRVMIAGKRCDMGLGGFPEVTLSAAREAARTARSKIRSGVDPIEERRTIRSEIVASRASAVTFDECVATYLKMKKAEWKNTKHASQWWNTLETYASPIIGNLLVRDVNQSHVMRIIEPLWSTKTETATRLRGRIESVLDWATVRGYRKGNNPARWKGHLDVLLATPGKIKKVTHHPALPYLGLGAFMVDLSNQPGMGARALEFAILTATRSGEVRGASWDEIDLTDKVWIIPANRMKMKKEHRIPLCNKATTILKALPRISGTKLIFPNTKGTQLSDMTLTAVLRRMKQNDITVHGFRATFRDWTSEHTSYSRDVCEMALAHTIGNKVEAAYRRGDLFEKRCRLMRDWGKFCTTVATTTNVTAIKHNLKSNA